MFVQKPQSRWASSDNKLKHGSSSLSELREKQLNLMKKMRVKSLARRKYVYEDFENLESFIPRSSSKRLLYLFCDNKRLGEKNFFGSLETEKSDTISKFHSQYSAKMVNIAATISTFESETDAEEYLLKVQTELSSLLQVEKENLRQRREGIAEKQCLVEHFEALKKMNEAKFAYRIAKLKKKLEAERRLEASEMLLLSLNAYQETNIKLGLAVASKAEICDELHETYLWARDAFVTRLAEASPQPSQQMCGETESDDESLPGSRDASLYDFIIKRDDLISGLAKIGKTAEQLTKYHYKLRDLKLRLSEAKSLSEAQHSENSLIPVTSTVQASHHPFFDHDPK